MAWETFIAVSDTHGDMIDADYEGFVLGFIKDHKPKHRWHLGDVFDLRPMRNGAGEEDRASGVKDDVLEGMRFLRAFRPDVVTWGNHDQRLWRMAANLSEKLEYEYARQLLKQIESEVNGWGCVTREYDVRAGWHEVAPGRLIGHGYASNMYPAKMNCLHFGSTLTGHVHAFSYFRMDNLRGDESFVSGCGCTVGMEYNRTHRRRLKHEVGFLYGAIESRTGDWQVFQVKRKTDGKWLDPTKVLKTSRKSSPRRSRKSARR